MKGSSSKTKRMKAIINHNKFVSDRKFKSKCHYFHTCTKRKKTYTSNKKYRMKIYLKFYFDKLQVQNI